MTLEIDQLNWNENKIWDFSLFFVFIEAILGKITNPFMFSNLLIVCYPDMRICDAEK